jgi:hypothetical protein
LHVLVSVLTYAMQAAEKLSIRPCRVINLRTLRPTLRRIDPLTVKKPLRHRYGPAGSTGNHLGATIAQEESDHRRTVINCTGKDARRCQPEITASDFTVTKLIAVKSHSPLRSTDNGYRNFMPALSPHNEEGTLPAGQRRRRDNRRPRD